MTQFVRYLEGCYISRLRHFNIYIYIYIYIFVCVCVSHPGENSNNTARQHVIGNILHYVITNESLHLFAVRRCMIILLTGMQV